MVTSAVSGNGAVHGVVLSLDAGAGRYDEHGRIWVTAVIDNRTSETVQVRLVHWGGNGIAPVLARHRAPNDPHPGFEQLSGFLSIDGGEVEVYPGVPVHVDIQFECVDDDRYMRSQPRSVFALLRDATGTMTNRVLLELPSVEGA